MMETMKKVSKDPFSNGTEYMFRKVVVRKKPNNLLSEWTEEDERNERKEE